MTVLYKYTSEAKRLMEVHQFDLTPIRGTSQSAGVDLKVCSRKPIRIAPYTLNKLLEGNRKCRLCYEVMPLITGFSKCKTKKGSIYYRTECKSCQIQWQSNYRRKKIYISPFGEPVSDKGDPKKSPVYQFNQCLRKGYGYC